MCSSPGSERSRRHSPKQRKSVGLANPIAALLCQVFGLRFDDLALLRVLLLAVTATMRLECHGVVRYLRSLLRVPQLNYSADELFSCDGFKTFDKILALEILATHIRALETRVDVAEEIDIMCPASWLAEQFIGQLLPHALPSCVVNDITDLHSLMKACTWLEDMEIDSHLVVRDIEAYMQDLPDAGRFNKSLNEDILQTYFNFAKELDYLKLESSTKPEVQYAIEPEPLDTLLTRDGGYKKGSSVQQTLLDGAYFNLKNEKSMHHNPIKAFELEPWDKDSPLEQYSGPTRQCTTRIGIPNLVRPVGESEVDEPTKLLDFDPADFLLEKLQTRANIVEHKIQAASSPSYVVGCLSLLDENSVAEDIKTAPKYAAMDTVKVLFELPAVLEDEYLGSFLDVKLGTYISTSLMKPNPVELEDLDFRDIPFQDFEKLLVLPELTLQTARFHFLQVPSFTPEHQARITEDVFEALFRAKALPSPTSASDWLYLDWHLSQVGHCNNYGCFHLQRRIIEKELSVTFQKDMISGKGMPELQLLLCLAEDGLPWHHADTECGNDTKEYPAAKLHASVSTSMLNFNNFLFTADKAEDRNYSDQSVLTDELRISTRNEVPLAGSSPTSMDSVLSLVKQARQGVLLRDAKLMQASENEFHQEGCQGNFNTINQSNDMSPVDYHVLATAPADGKIPRPNPSYSSGVDAASSYLFQASNHGEPELLKPDLDTPACPSKELFQMGSKSPPPLQPAFQELNPHQSEVDDLIQLSSGLGPHLVVVANILQPNGSILLQRRSSYQKILGLENEDLQVVERELMLPVDLILNPSTCLTIYTEEKLLGRTKICSSNSEGFYSCVMDTIVDCHMRALSFSFQRWFMIFEGELAFNSAVTNILNKLCILSAGFEIRVQGFISTNSTTTDSLVLRCIKKMWKMSKRPFDSPMSEDLTDGEICLATFPSLNPLSSHAILCLNVPIATFISWSTEEQNSALQGFDVRSESLNLLKAQALYGKLETTAHPGIFSQHSWPAASEIDAPETGRHGKDAFPYFPPASEIANCELEEKSARESDDGPPKEGHIDLYPPSCPDPVFKNHSAEQGIFTWNDVCWPNQPSVLPHHANGHTERPDCLEENYDHCNPVDVHSILQRWIQRRKDGGKDLKHTVTESELFCDSFKVLNNEPYCARPCLNKSSPSAEYTADAVHSGVHSTNSCEATDELQWAPLLKTSGKRNISALEQFRHRGSVSPALRFQKKKLKPAVPSKRTRDDGPSTQLDHSLKISRSVCNKFNCPPARSI